MRTHNRRDFLKAVGLATAAMATPGKLLAKQKQDRRPNILWILSEDISPELSCYGTQGVQTPNLDKPGDSLFQRIYDRPGLFGQPLGDDYGNVPDIYRSP